MDGTGVKVGVISDSYDKKPPGRSPPPPQDIVSDNLPGAANTCGHTTVIHGRGPSPPPAPTRAAAMMQIVHDLAPGSPLDFATAFISEPGFAANITALAAQGAR